MGINKTVAFFGNGVNVPAINTNPGSLSFGTIFKGSSSVQSYNLTGMSLTDDITITAFDEKILVAFVSSKQLDKLEELDFIERVTPPDLARTPPIPQVKIPESQTTGENQYDYLLWLVIGGIVFITVGIFKKRKKLKD